MKSEKSVISTSCPPSAAEDDALRFKQLHEQGDNSGDLGSYSFDDPDRPRWGRDTRLVAEYHYYHADGGYAYSSLKGENPDGTKTFLRGRRVQGTNDRLLANQENELYRLPGLEMYRKGTGDEPDLLYRLSEFVSDLAARPGDPVYICEGEKDADRLRNHGLIATTNPNGALNWKPEFNELFTGRDVVIMVDNDPKGRQRAVMIATALLRVAKTIKSVALSALPVKGDVSDWLDAGHTRDELLAEVAATASITPQSSFRLLDPGEWAGQDVPPREFAIHGLFLAKSLAALTGPGATGKSLLMQQAATAVATGKPFLGMKTTPGNAAYITAEDDERELHERQVAICKALDVELTALSERLYLASLIEVSDKALVRAGRNDRLLPSELLAALRQVIQDHGLKFVALDNAGHFYGADENVRGYVVAFLGLLNKLAWETGCAIVLIAHPNKSGATYSGVTAWQNQIRVQAHLSKPEGEHDSNVRELRLEKANYAPPGEPIRMLWHHGAFALENEVPADDPTRITALQLRQNEIFYSCLASQTAAQRPVSDAKTAGNYAPKMFARLPIAQGMTVGDFERTMERLFSGGMIERGQLDFNSGSTRNKAQGIRLTGQRGGDDEPPM